MFTLIIPTYNRYNDLKNCIQSIFQQSFPNFEIIVVDDNSDVNIRNNPPVLDQRLRYLHNSRNYGPAYSRNKAAKEAKYDWLVFIDDDDRMAGNKLQVLKKFIHENPNVDCLYHRAKIVMVNEGVSYNTAVSTFRKGYVDVGTLLERNFIGGVPVITVRKDIFLRVGGFDAELKALEDYDLVLNLAKNDAIFAPIDDVLTIYNAVTKRSSVSKNISNTKMAWSVIIRKYLSGEHKETRGVRENINYMIAHAHNMSLSRKSSFYYFFAYLCKLKKEYLAAAMVSLVSPSALLRIRSRKSAK